VSSTPRSIAPHSTDRSPVKRPRRITRPNPTEVDNIEAHGASSEPTIYIVDDPAYGQPTLAHSRPEGAYFVYRVREFDGEILQISVAAILPGGNEGTPILLAHYEPGCKNFNTNLISRPRTNLLLAKAYERQFELVQVASHPTALEGGADE
jgi:hypothetical protein